MSSSRRDLGSLGVDESCPEQVPPCLMGQAEEGAALRQGRSASGAHTPLRLGPHPCIWNLTALDLNLTSGSFRSGDFPCFSDVQ